jgi:methionyl-tRNA formyltransferase
MGTLTVGPFRRLLLLGGGELLVDLAVWARQHGFDVGVITSPRHAADPLPGSREPLSAVLASKGIMMTVIEDIASEKAKRMIGDGDNIDSTFSLSLGAAWIFKKDFIDKHLGGLLFNLHGSRLPQNRGGGAFSWQILTGNRFGFCTLHLIEDGVDTGDIVAYEEFIYPGACRTPADYMKYYREKNIGFLTNLLSSLHTQSKEFALVSQPEYLATYWPRLHSPDQAWIDWAWPAHQLERFVCAFDDPYCGAQTTWKGRTVRIKKAFASYQDGIFHPFQTGFVYRNNGMWLCVACDGGSVVIESVVDEHNNSVLPEIRVGDAFHTPTERLIQRTNRVFYTPRGLVK